MGKLIIPVGAVTKRQSLEITETAEASEIQTGKVLAEALQRLQLTGALSAVDSDYLFQGTLSGTFQRECDRCLEPAETVVDLEVTWLFEPAPPEDESEEGDYNGIEEVIDVEEEDNRVYYYDDENINLATPAWEELLLAAPSKIYCQEDCHGLCPQCGANWNTGTCECQEETEVKNTGLSGLKEMFPDLPAGPSEE